jgi:hypothetical protein
MITDNSAEANLLAVVGAILTTVVILSIVFNYWMAPAIFEQNRQAGEDIAKDTINAEKAVQDYQEFRRLYYDIQSAREQLENYKRAEHRFHNETWPDGGWKDSRDARTRHSRMHDRITGQRNQVSNLVAEYNSMSADATTKLYQCHLPYNIQSKLYIADASGVEYKTGADTGPAPEEPDESCKYSEVPDSALNSTG